MEREKLKKEQMVEAVSRMKILNLNSQVVEDFISNQILHKSDYAVLYYLNSEEYKMVREWEKQTDSVVYHVIKTHMSFGLCYSYLYVSKYQEEWEMDKHFLKELCPLVYVKNVDDECCSEYGSIGIRPIFGGVVRTE